MSYRNRLRAQPVSRATIDAHNKHTPLTYPELRAEQRRAGDHERKRWEKQRERDFENMHRKEG